MTVAETEFLQVLEVAFRDSIGVFLSSRFNENLQVKGDHQIHIKESYNTIRYSCSQRHLAENLEYLQLYVVVSGFLLRKIWQGRRILQHEIC